MGQEQREEGQEEKVAEVEVKEFVGTKGGDGEKGRGKRRRKRGTNGRGWRISLSASLSLTATHHLF